jgi:hypothetical protein
VRRAFSELLVGVPNLKLPCNETENESPEENRYQRSYGLCNNLVP